MAEEVTFRIQYNDFGIVFVSAVTFEDAEKIFRNKYLDILKQKIKEIKVISGEIIK